MDQKSPQEVRYQSDGESHEGHRIHHSIGVRLDARRNILQSAWFEKDVEAAENATSTPMTASSTPKFIKSEFKKIYENYPFPPFLLKIC
jgi:hypothetical protein